MSVRERERDCAYGNLKKEEREKKRNSDRQKMEKYRLQQNVQMRQNEKDKKANENMDESERIVKSKQVCIL